MIRSRYCRFALTAFCVVVTCTVLITAQDGSSANVLLERGKGANGLAESLLRMTGSAVNRANASGSSSESQDAEATPTGQNLSTEAPARPNLVELSFPSATVPTDHFTTVYSPLPGYAEYRSGPMIIPIIVGNISLQPPVYEMFSTVVLVRDGENNTCNILVDTGLPIDRNVLIANLATHGIRPGQVDYVVLTHGHPDHTGNQNLFPSARTFFGRLGMRGHAFIEYRDTVGREEKQKYVRLCQSCRIYATAGHTSSDLSLVVSNVQGFGTVAMTGDLFSNANDLAHEEIWRKFSSFPRHQEQNRRMILCLSDVIFPGHGPPFRVNAELRKMAGCADA